MITTPPTTDPATSDASTTLAAIHVTNETPGGYKRELFFEWQTDPATGCSVRDDVLVDESSTAATTNASCTVTGGTWDSIYDNITITDPSKLDVDHLIPLKEAWDSGAGAWDPATRTAFANDLTDPRTLIAVTASSNRSKGDRDPSNWIPPNPETLCTYLGDWIAVKARWQLTMDQSEAGRIRNLLRDDCPSLLITNWSAPTITLTTSATPAATAPVPTSTELNTPAATTPVYYASCTAARDAGAAPLHSGDPGYRPALDRDHDGTACE